jgi:hypothetical protein
VWHYFSGDEAIDAGDRAWARRQAAEAQNHIFDRYDTLLLSLHRLRTHVVLASVSDCALSPEKMIFSSYQTTSRVRRRLAQFCTLAAQLTPHAHHGSFPRKMRASHMQRTLCLRSVAMKSCYVGWLNWTMPKRAPQGQEALMLDGGSVARKSLVYSDNSQMLRFALQMARHASRERTYNHASQNISREILRILIRTVLRCMCKIVVSQNIFLFCVFMHAG